MSLPETAPAAEAAEPFSMPVAAAADSSRPRRGLLAKLHRVWTLARRLPTEQQFLEGEPINYGGLLFVLDPADETIIHIAIPLDDFERSEIPDMRKEAREAFVEFVGERPSLAAFAGQRALLIRVVASYDRFEEEIGERVRIDRWRESGPSFFAVEEGYW